MSAGTGNRYVVDFHHMEKQPTLGKTSTGEGASFNGDRIYCGLVTKKKGTGSKAHFHPDETFNYVLKGALQVNMDGKDFVVPTGMATSLRHVGPDRHEVVEPVHRLVRRPDDAAQQ